MSNRTFIRSTAALLIVLFVAPAAFFAAPQRASAQVATIASAARCLGIGGLLGTGGVSIVTSALAVPVADFVTRAETTVSAGANSTDCIMTTILMPLARLLARIVLQQITASTINWINGSNGSGQTSYVQNLSVHLQGVGDSSAFAFLGQLSSNIASPFASAISSSLRINYLQQTSVGGFFAANQNTLAQYSPNVNGFLAGNWSQGGIPAWFALTTQSQNNPFTFYQSSQSELAAVVGGATSARQQELSWANGFLSWCGVTAAAAQTQGNASNGYQACIADCNTKGYTATCADNCGSSFTQSGGTVGGATTGAGGTCTNADGTPGKTQTPGSIIHDYTQQAVVNSGISQLVSANDLDSALGAIISALGKQLLGAAGGLFGASQPTASRPSLTTTVQNYSGTNSSGSVSSGSVAQSTLANITAYTTAWNTISAAANTASASVDNLVSYCNSKSSDPNASAPAISAAQTAAQIARTTEIGPTLTQAQTAINSVASTKAFATQVQNEAAAASSVSSVSSDAATKLSNDVQTLSTMPPTPLDVINAQQNASPFGGATASPDGSLTVSGGSTVDQMNLISTNAAALQKTCDPVAPTVSGDSGGS